MLPADTIVFGPFRLRRGALWRGDEEIPLQPRPLAVLRHLAENPGHVVSKEALRRAVWGNTHVSDTTLKVCVRAVRVALGDDATAPRYVETVGRAGYRFVAAGAFGAHGGRRRLVSRDDELARLGHWFAEATRGRRRVAFVTGEAGIGKTALLTRFLADVRRDDLAWVAEGHCLEHRGEDEPYLPVIDALGRLCREPGAEGLPKVLARHAPAWRPHLPALARDQAAIDASSAPSPARERMLRELVDALEVATAERPLVFVLEDLHWSDVSTLDLVSRLAARSEPARLLVVGTYRPADVIARAHPLRGLTQDLRARGFAEMLDLELLTRAAIQDYLQGRFGEGDDVRTLATIVHDRTQGNALFMVELVDHLLSRGLVAYGGDRVDLRASREEIERSVPESLRQLIDRQIERLEPAEQRLLEAASAVGMDFAAAAVAAALAGDVDDIDERCERFAWTGSFLEERGVAAWPDGTVSGRYGFVHVLHRHVLYERLAAARRVRLHRALGERLEVGWVQRTSEIAGELALHFERGHVPDAAIRWLLQAAKNAVARDAQREAAGLLDRGLPLLELLREPAARQRLELLLLFHLVAAIWALEGIGSPRVERLYERLRTLARELGDASARMLVVPALRAYHYLRGELAAAREYAEEFKALAEESGDPFVTAWAHYGLGETLLAIGELAAARRELEAGSAFEPDESHTLLSWLRGVQHPGVACLANLAATLWYAGDMTEARRQMASALASAERIASPASLIYALDVAALLDVLEQDAATARRRARTVIELAEEHDLPFWVARARFIEGWATAVLGDPTAGSAAIEGAFESLGSGHAIPRAPLHLALAAEVCLLDGRAPEGLAAVDEALKEVERSEGRCWLPELLRLRGELLHAAGDNADGAQQSLRRAIAVAREQGARSWEQRAAASLARVRRSTST